MMKQILGSILLLLLLGACSQDNVSPTSQAVPTNPPSTLAPPVLTGIEAAVADASGGTDAAIVIATDVPPTPTPTKPLAALVNDQPIYLAEYEQALALYQQGVYFPPPDSNGGEADYRGLALDLLVEKALIQQAAAAQGLTVSIEAVKARLEEERQLAGSEDNFQAWLAANQMNEAQYEAGVAEAMLTQALMEVITADVPYAVEQVRARYIQVDDESLAAEIETQLRASADFAALARQYSLERHTGENGGDLSYFPRNTLLVPEVEAAAFALDIGEISDVISVPNSNGSNVFYILQVTDKDPQRALAPEQRALLLKESFESWLQNYRAQADIQILIDAGS